MGLDKGGGRGGMEGWFFLFIVFIFDKRRKIVSCCLIMLLFFLSLPFQCRSTDFVLSSIQLLDGYLLQDFSSSPNLVTTFLFGNNSVRVNCG